LPSLLTLAQEIMNTLSRLIFQIVLSCLAVGCSTSGSGRISSSAISQTDRRVVMNSNTEERIAELMPELTATLRNAGFDVVSSGPASYRVSVTFAGGGFDLTCSIVMYKDGVPVVSGKGVNPGLGVWLARDSAYKGVFEGALKQFEARL